MIIFRQAAAISRYLNGVVGSGKTIGFVPTMGALHQGHLSLIEAAKSGNDCSVCSIFVNPTQFNNATDFAKYPITIANDINLLEAFGCAVLFLPDVAEIYPNGTALSTPYPLGDLEKVLEGQYRPGHFQGVCQVVERLLRIVQPQRLYLGGKDYQQCRVIQKLVALKDLPVSIEVCPTLREADGLAMSSRNMRLSPEARLRASAIFDTLQFLQQQLAPGELTPLIEEATTTLTEKGFEVDYIAFADAQSLTPRSVWDGQSAIVALIAAFCDGVRLIDNMVLY
jgi:pantoate--beta-alanine ligase